MKKSKFPVRVIDLFAGPGGLSEGFESYRSGEAFKCVLSIEKDSTAHRTLLLRAFFRQFKRAPDAYYRFMRGELSVDELFELFPKQHKLAATYAVRLTLAKHNRQRVDELVAKVLRGNSKPWVLIGGPPCQAYSLAGRARRRKELRSEFEKDGRHFLYKEYLRIVQKFRPTAFVMENVKGLLSSSALGIAIFQRMLSDFASAGYSIHSFVTTGDSSSLMPADYIIESEKYGIPQTRHRVILLGLRAGLDRGTACLESFQSQISVSDAIKDLPRIRSQVSPLSRDSLERWKAELRRMRSSFGLDGRLRVSKRPLNSLGVGGRFVHRRMKKDSGARSGALKKWFLDRRMEGVTLHEARHHMPADLRRYLFAAEFAKKTRTSPRIADFPPHLRPKHSNLMKAINEAVFSDRFRVQLAGKPCSTVVSHISKDGHYYIHYDASQCRSFTVREAARIQTFPDNYFFLGSKTEQYHQVGNAVPPLLARQAASIVWSILRGRLSS